METAATSPSGRGAGPVLGTIAFLALASVASQAMVRALDTLLPQIAADIGTTVGTASIVVTAYASTHGTVQLIIGPIGDRMGKYRVVAVACALSSVMVVLCGLAQSLTGLAIARLASGGRFPGGNALFLGRDVYRAGAVCVAMTGNIAVDTIVAQGCRPIGRPMAITRGHDNVIEQIDRQKPTDVLRELFESLDERDQTLFRHSLFVGLEMQKDQVEVPRGEFLVRNLLGMDPTSGGLAVGAQIQPWQVVQFLLRDARTAAEDLAMLLDRYRGGGAHPSGALLFSCLGRGMHLYGRPDHDTGLFHERLGRIPLGGFFCNGEIGPVGGSTFLHGYTSAFGLFRPASS